MPNKDALCVGDVVVAKTYELDRRSLARYAGASGDFNPIHYNDSYAEDAGLPGVIAHGMLTMSLAISAVTDWLGDPAAVLEYGTRFAYPVQVPGRGSVAVHVSATVREIGADTLQLALNAQVDGQDVLGRARATVRLDSNKG
ncbi:MaoC/PaaZ C-terminal domain-containing protein [Dermabacteraceae bacterium P13115]